jgi:adenine-specific DNA-methyltransferase
MKLLIFSSKDNEIIKPLFKNSNINKWLSDYQISNYVIYSTKNTDIKKYNGIEKHLLKYKVLIEKIRQNESEKWFSIVRPRDINIFINEKIVCPQRSNENKFAYDNSEFFCSSDVYYIVNPIKNIELKYILAILNSKLIFKWLYYRGKRKGEMLELYQEPLSKIPIKQIPETAQIPFITLVNQILEGKKAGQDTSGLEHQIDVMVYHLYVLSYEEACVIDKDLKKEDFEKYKI